MTTQYYRGSHGIIIIYDITDRSTFDHVESWIKDVVKTLEGNSVQTLLIGNKNDLESKRQVSKREGLEFATKWHMSFIETSALKGKNCEKAMEIIMADVFNAAPKKKLKVKPDLKSQPGKRTVVAEEEVMMTTELNPKPDKKSKKGKREKEKEIPVSPPKPIRLVQSRERDPDLNQDDDCANC